MKGKLVKIYGARDPALEEKRMVVHPLPPPSPDVLEVMRVLQSVQLLLERQPYGRRVQTNDTLH